MAPTKQPTIHAKDKHTEAAMCNNRITDASRVSAVATLVTCKTCLGWLKQDVRSARMAQPTKIEAQLAESIAAAKKRPKSTSVSELKAGAILTKLYKGATHKVTVLGPSRFRYGREEHSSLSAIAEQIMAPNRKPGSKGRVSGVEFFGLAAGSSPGRRTSSPTTLLMRAAELIQRAQGMVPVTRRASRTAMKRGIAQLKLAAKLSTERK